MKFQAFKSTYSHTLQANYLRQKYIPHKKYTQYLSNNVMEKIPLLVKDKENFQQFCWAFSRLSFPCRACHQNPMSNGFNLLGNCYHVFSSILCGMLLKEGCITACLDQQLLNVSIIIIRHMTNRIYSNFHFHCKR